MRSASKRGVRARLHADPPQDVRALIGPILDRAARKVRHALISVLDMPEADTTALLRPDLDEPCGLTPPDESLARQAAGDRLPVLRPARSRAL
jgi:hypothetical protein